MARSLLVVIRRQPPDHPEGLPAPERGPMVDTPTATPHEPVREIGRYRVDGEIGRGSTGVVYRATDTLIGRAVALKVLRLAGDGDEDQRSPGSTAVDAVHRASFLHEAQNAGALSHPGIVTVYDVLEDDHGDLVLAMELVEGGDLAGVIAEGGFDTFAEVVDVVDQIAAALDHLHDRGLIHRDVKPANILLTESGHPKLTDLGIASRTGLSRSSHGEDGAGDEDSDPKGGDRMVLGTPVYMPPEQILGGDLDHRADIYGLGVVVYELLAGRRPFVADQLSQLVREIVHDAPPPVTSRYPQVDVQGLEAVLGRALAKEPGERFDSAGELAQALAGLLYHAAHAAPAPATGTVDLGDDDVTLSESTLGEGRRQQVAQALPGAGATPPGPTAGRGRWVLAALVLLALVLGVVAGALLLPDGDEPAVASLGPAAVTEDEREALRSILAQGEALLEEGRPREAALLFEAARRIAPPQASDLADWQRLARLRVEAERRAEEAQEADTTLATRSDDDVVTSARSLLDERGAQGGARALTDLVQAKRRALEGGGETSPTPRTASDPVDPTAPSRLDISLSSEAPSGVLMAYADDRQILRRAFSFSESRALWFDRPSSGSLSETLDLPPGTETLRLYVSRDGESPTVLDVRGPFDGGGHRSVEITLPEEGAPSLVEG